MAPTAPPIDGELWINTEPLTPEHLEGRAVVLVFWSAGCEAALRRLQQIQSLVDGAITDGGDAVAIAVHTPRMTCDNEVDRLRHVVRRHRVTMPVVHDPRYLTWTRYEPPGWPSTAVIDRRGKITGIATGCHDIELIEMALADALQQRAGRRQDDVVPPALPVAEPSVDHGAGESDPARIMYPEGITALRLNNSTTRLALADTGNDRLIIGRGDLGLRTFRVDLTIIGLDQPSAITFTAAETVAVVERGSNAVTTVDLATGRRALITDRLLRPVGLTTDLDGSIVITDAGADRLYRATANSDHSGYLVLPIAGTGRTGVKAGRADEAELAQPVAAVRTGAGLVFADAASSNLRLLTDRGDVINITDSDLFDGGLIDGPAHRARLQRPAGLTALPDGSIVVVDNGNNRLRRLHHRRVETLGLNGLDGPTAVAALGADRLLVADTNRHRLIAVDPIRHDAWTVTIDGLEHQRPITAHSSTKPFADTAAVGQVSSGSATSAT